MNDSKRTSNRRPLPRHNALTVALMLGMGVSGLAFGQATTGTIFGSTPQQSGGTVIATNASGVSRSVQVSDGRYVLNSLPAGEYTVTLKRDGEVVATRNNVTVQGGAGTAASFTGGAANAQNLAEVQVTANLLPTIDVTNVNSQTVITARQLEHLPISHNAEAIALLAPGAVKGSTAFGNLISFGGSSVTENAYYINGFNTTDPLSGFGGMTLPYGSIQQQQTMTGGYGAKYGRSDGGVISQIGKSGTNTWHFGGQLRWTPRALTAGNRSQYYPGGGLYNYNSEDGSWQTQASAYIGGPLIKDHLFIFAAAQFTKVHGSDVQATSVGTKRQYQQNSPDYYLKLNWNINDSNIIEVTGARNETSYWGQFYGYDNATFTEGGFQSNDTSTVTTHKLWSVKYTGYLTDNLTLSAMYGQLKHKYFNATPGYDPSFPHIFSPENQNPGVPGYTGHGNSNVIGRFDNPKHRAKNTNLRVNLTWILGNHTITAGIDNQDVYDLDDGTTTSGPGYAWEYNVVPDPVTYITGGPGTASNWQNKLWVDATGAYPGGVGANGKGYYVAKYIYQNQASVKVTQRAQYIQDKWQINDRWMVSVGLRNDQFTNFNPHGIPYVRLTSPQWSPRLGFTWDVYGDSSFKVYGNAGRYYLAMPASVARRSAGGSLYTRTYYTYTSIDANGIPQHLTAIDTSRGKGQPISVNNEYGVPRDPKTATATNLTAEYQDEFILGFDKMLGSSWVYGAKATYRKLRNGIDDVGDNSAIAAKMVQMGLVDQATANALKAGGQIPASVLFNPVKTNVFNIPNLAGTGYYVVPMSMDDFGFNSKMKRAYWGLDLYLEHPFDGTWYGKITYTLSHSYGNSEGQVRSDIGQADVSTTVDWDYAQVMDAAGGDLSNDRRHQLKAYAFYQLTPDWTVSGNVLVMSGSPRTCLGLYGPNQTNPGLGYGPYYHFCDGKPFPPGTQHNAWQYTLDLGVQYAPGWAQHRLKFAAHVQNVFNHQSVTRSWSRKGLVPQRWPDGHGPMAMSYTAPRAVTVSVSYDY